MYFHSLSRTDPHHFCHNHKRMFQTTAITVATPTTQRLVLLHNKSVHQMLYNSTQSVALRPYSHQPVSEGVTGTADVTLTSQWCHNCSRQCEPRNVGPRLTTADVMAVMRLIPLNSGRAPVHGCENSRHHEELKYIYKSV